MTDTTDSREQAEVPETIEATDKLKIRVRKLDKLETTRFRYIGGM
jgi:hypothetical protein